MILFAMLVAGVLTQCQPSTESVLLSGNGFSSNATNVVVCVPNAATAVAGTKQKVREFAD